MKSLFLFIAPRCIAKSVAITIMITLPAFTQELVWEQTKGPYGGNIQIRSLLVALDGTLYAGTEGEGIFRFDNSDSSWINVGLKNTNIIWALATSGTTIYAGSEGDGVFLSKDEGNTWVNVGLTNIEVRSLLVSGNMIYAGTMSGIYRRLDNDNSAWVNIGLTKVLSMAISDTTIYAGTEGDGVFYSKDGGTTWSNTKFSNISYVYSLAILDTNVYAGTTGSIFRSSDGGDTWTLELWTELGFDMRSLIILDRTFYVGNIAISWDSFNVGGVLRSDSVGKNLIQANTGLTNPSIWALAMSGTTIYAGTDGGVFRSDDRGKTWTPFNRGRTRTDVGALTISGATIYAGTDEAGIFRSSDEGDTWIPSNIGLTDQWKAGAPPVLSLAVSGTTVYAGTAGDIGGIYRSNDEGSSWIFKGKRTGATDISLAISGTTIYAAQSYFRSLFSSEDGGNTWESKFAEDIEFSSLVVMGSKIYAGTRNRGVYRSEDAGITWNTDNTGLGTRAILSLMVLNGIIFAGTDAGVYRSEDGGRTWVGTNLRGYIYSLIVSGSSIYAGTRNRGAYRSVDGGNYWVSIGLIDKSIRSLLVSGNILYVGTEGAGVFRASLLSLSTNNPPVIAAISDKEVDEGQTLQFTISATDTDNDSLTYSAENLPRGATFDRPTRAFSWIPDFEQDGSYDVTFRVSDGKDTVSRIVRIVVNDLQVSFANITINPSANTITDAFQFGIEINNLNKIGTLDTKDIEFISGEQRNNLEVGISQSDLGIDVSLYKLPRLNEPIKAVITKIDGRDVNIESDNLISLYYVTDIYERPYGVQRDGYSFSNSSTLFSSKRIRRLYSEIDNRPVWRTWIYERSAVINGVCYGMASSSNAYFKDPQLKPNRNINTYDMSSIDVEVLDKVIQYHMSQIVEPFPSSSNMGELASKIIEQIKSNNPVVLSMEKSSSERRHVVSVYKIVQDIKAGVIYAYLYDNVFPGEAHRYATINLKNNSFEYGPTFTGGPYTRAEIKSGRLLSKQQITDKIDQQTFGWIQDLWNKGKQIVGLNSPASMLVTDINGRRLGFIGGIEKIDEIPDSRILEFDDGDGHQALSLYIPKDLQYAVTYFGKDLGTMELFAIIPESADRATVLDYQNIPITPNTIATLEITDDSDFRLKVDTNNDRTFDLTYAPQTETITSIPEELNKDSLTPDFNGDGVVDFDDFFLFADVFGTLNDKFDLDRDRLVNFDDFFIFADAFGKLLPKIVVTPAGTQHKIVLVSAGEFTMGSNSGYHQDERPVLSVYLDAFWIDQYQVTVAQYRGCVQAGVCSTPPTSRACTWNVSGSENRPINCVNWFDAQSYCAWAGLRLPTEAEWEKAARGTDGRRYPWGEEFDESRIFDELEYDDLYFPDPVDSHPGDVSPYGVYNMASIVGEWVADWYSDEYYLRSPLRNPKGPENGTTRVIRGGSTTFDREGGYYTPEQWSSDLGFRCARYR